MPDCLHELNVNAALLIESLTYTENFSENIMLLVNNPFLNWIVISDGPVNPSGRGFGKPGSMNYPHKITKNMKHMYSGEEWNVFDQFKDKGWNMKMFDAFSGSEVKERIHLFRWMLVGNKS